MDEYERKENRYHRRKAKREARRLAMLETYNFERASAPDALRRAAMESRRGVMWKTSVQRYNIKRFKIMCDRYRNKRKRHGLRMTIICGLHNMDLPFN